MKYRANVAGILRNAAGQILVCERLRNDGAWQFPQGGIDEGETPEQGLARELWEEIGVLPEHYRIVTSRGPYRYLYGSGRIKKGFNGKEQIYYLCDFIGDDSHIHVDTAHPEFQAFRWIAPGDFKASWLPESKKEVYSAVFAEFFGIKL